MQPVLLRPTPCAPLRPALCCAGKQLLSVWDSLCQLLRARQVSVEDVSNKSGMLLRVLHTAAFGTTWWVVGACGSWARVSEVLCSAPYHRPADARPRVARACRCRACFPEQTARTPSFA